MQDEFDALQRNNTWNLVPPTSSMNIVGSKWVFRVKYNLDGLVQKYKARLVAQGFCQTPGIDFHETFSHVIKPSIIGLILTLAASNNWLVHQLDINNAFLNGHLQEKLFMSQPQGFVDSQFPTHVCQLNKDLYRLKQAPRARFDKLRFTLLHWGLKIARLTLLYFISMNNKKSSSY